MISFLSRQCLFIALLLLMLMTARAQFGVKDKDKAKDGNHNTKNQLDLENDPELLAAMEIFAGMSPEEMEETMKELTQMLGDDPETLSAIRDVMKEIPNLKTSDIQSSLKEMVSEDEVAAATQDALKLLGKSNWETIWEKQDLILEAVIQSGQLSANDAALYKSDKDAWEKELRFIWNELQKQAAASSGKDEL
ncbi:expressed unknown protein [Seminavis robusta]|uniref:Uncharacterized protein n=1 Tax=Seminavis robusta TaxID=568900 RepID=A0A9N8EGY6_9STRA|nr:expressed unknown protein [Seminavis robusta]|eukprot:Sro979_g227260.1 n/a (193) ;mRNA; r:22441-23019